MHQRRTLPFRPSLDGLPWARALPVLLALGLLAGMSACGGDDDEGSGATTTAQGNAAFCAAAAQASTDQFSPTDPNSRQAVLTQIDQMVATAPPAIKNDVTTLRSLMGQFSDYMNQLMAAGRDPNKIQQLQAQGQQLEAQIGPVINQLSGFVQQNCPGVTMRTLPPGPATGG